MTQTTEFLDRCLFLAESIAKECIQLDEGVECFNLVTFLDRLVELIDEHTGDFALDASEAARFLWCCLAPEPGAN